jgi:hypothetical protein
MTTWIRHHRYLFLVIGALVEGLMVFSFRLLLGDEAENAGPNAVFGSVMLLVVGFLVLHSQNMVREKAKEQGLVRCYFRRPDAIPGSLSNLWNTGYARLSGGQIQLQTGLESGLDPSVKVTTLPVLGAAGERHKPDRRGLQTRMIQPYGLQALVLETPEGALEVAAYPEILDQVDEIVLRRVHRADLKDLGFRKGGEDGGSGWTERPGRCPPQGGLSGPPAG